MTFTGVASFICGIIGLWPIWSFLTVIYMVILFMGYTMALTFLPGGLIGSLLFWILTIGIASTSNYFTHDPVW